VPPLPVLLTSQAGSLTAAGVPPCREPAYVRRVA